MMNQQQPPPSFTLDELGARWGPLLTHLFGQNIMLEKQLAAVQADNAALSLEIERLRRDIRQAQTDLLAAQDSKVINNE